MACDAIPDDPGIKVLFACENFGYFSVTIAYEVGTLGAAVSLHGDVAGSMIVDAPSPNQDSSRNHRYCTAVARIYDRRDDCMVKWSNTGEDVRTLIQIRTVESGNL